MLGKLDSVHADVSELKPWEKRSYKSYQIEKIKLAVMSVSGEDRIKLIKQHILNGDPNDFGASCIDIYLVAYVAEQYITGKQAFYEYVLKNGITDKPNSAQAIWQVGKGDGVYLKVLNILNIANTGSAIILNEEISDTFSDVAYCLLIIFNSGRV